jgi:SAM-dependent methyltransferase
MRLTGVWHWLTQPQKRLPADLFDGRTTLDIGCGRQKRPGSIGLDICPHAGVDIVADLNGCLPVKDGQFDAVNADQVLEHVADLPGLVREIHRVLRPSGILVAHVPYFRSSWAHVDPTHVRSFTLRSMDYFVAGSPFFERYRFNEAKFQTIDIFLDGNRDLSYLRGVCAAVALARPDRFENSFLSFVYPFELLTFILRKG